MSLKDKILSVFKNKVLFYISSRYLTYGIQFINSMFIAIALGPEFLAVWGFLNMILQYISQVNFGIPYSLNVLMSINKNDECRIQALLSTSFWLYGLLSVVIVLVFSLMEFCGINIGDKYNFSDYAILIILIAIMTHFNTLLTTYFRVENKLLEIVFFQSVLPVSMLVAIILSEGEELLRLMLWLMFFGQILSMIIYLKNIPISLIFPNKQDSKLLLKKGAYLFIYNTCFYFIMLTTRSVVSSVYKVEEFGFFTFSFTLANTIMLLFDSFSFLIYPKTINRLNQADKDGIFRIMNIIRSLYITSVHLVMYVFIISFPFIIRFFPQYSSIFRAFTLMAMTVVLYTNCFAYSSFLTAKGKEVVLGRLAFVALLINVSLSLFISKILEADYSFVILATMIAYIFYSIMLSRFSYIIIGIHKNILSLIVENFPIRLFAPFFIALFVSILGVPNYCYFIVLILFIVLNRKEIKYIKESICKVVKEPSIINI